MDQAWSESLIEDMIENPSYLIYGVYHQSKFVGFIIGMMIVDEAEIHMICIDPNYQRQGIAEKLMNYFTQELQNRCFASIFLEVNDRNIKALSLYKKLSFETIGQRSSYYKDNSSAILMRKYLDF